MAGTGTAVQVCPLSEERSKPSEVSAYRRSSPSGTILITCRPWRSDPETRLCHPDSGAARLKIPLLAEPVVELAKRTLPETANERTRRLQKPSFTGYNDSPRSSL